MSAMTADDDHVLDLAALRTTPRRDRQTWPFVLVVLGLTLAAATPFYLRPTLPAAGATSSLRTTAVVVPGPLALGLQPVSRLGSWSWLYWLVALPVAYVLIVLNARRRAARRGIAGPVAPAVLVGLALLGLLLLAVGMLPAPAASALWTGLGGPFMLLAARGLGPLLVVAVGLLVLARTERSAVLVVVGVVFLGLALTANLYDLGNPVGELTGTGLGRFAALPNLLAPALLLVIAGSLATLRRRAGRAR